jgi:hypothetical protein
VNSRDLRIMKWYRKDMTTITAPAPARENHMLI